MNNLVKIEPLSLKEGLRFSAPVFFDDGKNMFLAAGKSVKQYHLKAVARWKIPFLLTYGKVLSGDEPLLSPKISENPAFTKNPSQANFSSEKAKNSGSAAMNSEDVEELEELDDAEVLEELEEI